MELEREPAQDLGWHVVSGEDFLAMLIRAYSGEDPDLLFAEWWANADHEWEDGDEE